MSSSYMAYVKFEKVFDPKLDANKTFAILGKDSEDIFEKSKKYGEDPYFVSGMYELGKDWDVLAKK